MFAVIVQFLRPDHGGGDPVLASAAVGEFGLELLAKARAVEIAQRGFWLNARMFIPPGVLVDLTVVDLKPGVIKEGKAAVE